MLNASLYQNLKCQTHFLDIIIKVKKLQQIPSEETIIIDYLNCNCNFKVIDITTIPSSKNNTPF